MHYLVRKNKSLAFNATDLPYSAVVQRIKVRAPSHTWCNIGPTVRSTLIQLYTSTQALFPFLFRPVKSTSPLWLRTLQTGCVPTISALFNACSCYTFYLEITILNILLGKVVQASTVRYCVCRHLFLEDSYYWKNCFLYNIATHHRHPVR